MNLEILFRNQIGLNYIIHPKISHKYSSNFKTPKILIFNFIVITELVVHKGKYIFLMELTNLNKWIK